MLCLQVHSTLISHLRSYPHNLLSPTSFARLVFFFFHCKSNHITLVLRKHEQLLARFRYKQKVLLDPQPHGSRALRCIPLQCPATPRLSRGSSWATECGVSAGPPVLSADQYDVSAGRPVLSADLERPHALHLPSVLLPLPGGKYTCSSPAGSRRLRITSKVSRPASGRSPSGSKDARAK